VGWAVVLILLNIGYNLYPIWLQQYLRVRLQRQGLSVQADAGGKAA
jgi:hypothetical protein